MRLYWAFLPSFLASACAVCPRRFRLETHHPEQASSKSRKNSSALWRQRINYSVHGPSCALHNAVRDILGRICTILRHVFCCSKRSGLNHANGNSEGEDDRKERFHGTKGFVPDGPRAPIRLSSIS